MGQVVPFTPEEVTVVDAVDGVDESLRHCPSILDRFADDLASAGVAGERRAAKLLYLALTSRFLDRPVSVAVKGPSAGGKSYLVEQVLAYFPDDAYYALSAMSERALAYDETPLKHRFLIIYEAAGLTGDIASYLVRSLLSEGRVRYVTVESGKDGVKPRLIEREGPTGLLVTTTMVRLHPENETRLLSITVADTPAQTRAILQAHARDAELERDERPWLALQEWLAETDKRTVIPYAEILADLIPPVAVRLRRDFAALLSLIRSHAVLHQAQRERDAKHRIVATLEDYAEVRDLIADLVAEAAEHTVPLTVRETVETVRSHIHGRDAEANVVDVARVLGIDKSAALRRVRAAVSAGYLVNLEERRGRPARLIMGSPMPEEQPVLPTVEAVARLTG